jgi:uncharacterized cupin superfamily protein
MHSTPTPDLVALGPEFVLHLDTELEITALAVTPSFWAHGSSASAQLARGRVLAVFDYTATWPYWERHPSGDEVVYLLAGDVELLLDDGLERRALPLGIGQAAIVRAGTWHRAVVHAPSRLLFVTPTPTQTQQRAAKPDDAARGDDCAGDDSC